MFVFLDAGCHGNGRPRLLITAETCGGDRVGGIDAFERNAGYAFQLACLRYR